MPEKCIIYFTPSEDIFAERRKNTRIILLSNKDKIKKSMAEYDSYELKSIGITPEGVFGAYLAFKIDDHKRNGKARSLHEMVILDILKSEDRYSLQYKSYDIEKITLKSGASLTYTIKTSEGDTFCSTLFKNSNKSAGIRPVNQLKRGPYNISSPIEMYLKSLENAIYEKNPLLLDRVESFFR